MSTNNPNQSASTGSEGQQQAPAAAEQEAASLGNEASDAGISTPPTPLEAPTTAGTAADPVEATAETSPGAEDSAGEETPASAEAASQEPTGETGEMGGAEDFGAILDAHERQHHAEVSEGEVVKGTVEKITEQGVIIDIGFKSEGMVPINARQAAREQRRLRRALTSRCPPHADMGQD
jgi:S1 RNA binding domain